MCWSQRVFPWRCRLQMEVCEGTAVSFVTERLICVQER